MSEHDVIAKIANVKPMKSGAAPSSSLLVSAHDIVSTASAPEYLIHGLIERNTLASLIAPWGAGKSVITLDIAIRITLGMPVHGRKVRSGPVVIVAGEGHGGIARRLAAWQAHHCRQIPADCLQYTRRAVGMRHPEAVLELHAEIDAVASRIGSPPALIVLDTLSRNFGPGDENSNSDMASFVEAVDTRLRLPFGAAVLVLHHPGHLDKTRGRGASALPGAVDVEYMLETDEAGVIRMTAPNKRPRDFRAADALHWRIVPVPLLLGDQAVEAVTVDEVEADDYVEQPKKGGMRKGQTAMLEILATEIERRRANLTGADHDPEQARIRADDWRQLGIDAGVLNPHRNAWYKLRTSFIERRLIRMDGTFVELVQSP